MAGRSGLQTPAECGSTDPLRSRPICPDLGYPPPLPFELKRTSTMDMSELMPKIQAATAKRSANVSNNLPTVVPAPQKQYFGVLGQRHVICICGVPNNGKAFIAHELGWYLEFFHGAKVEYFEVERYAQHGRKDENANALLDDILHFLRKAGGIGASGRDSDEYTYTNGVPDLEVSSSSSAPSPSKDSRFHARKSHETDSGRVAIVLAPRMSALAALDNEQAKEMWSSTWSCTNALDRSWIRRSLSESQKDCKLMFVEIELTDPELLRMHADATGPAERQKLEKLREWFECSYTPLGRSASYEKDISFMRYRNFRDMETHAMHGYLRMRVAQFLSVLRPWKHTVYLSRHGESTYNVEKKLGGDPPRSAAGAADAKRRGSYAGPCLPANPHTGNKVAARLWTSSLQRTELTAAYIPHPEVAVSELETRTEGPDAAALEDAEVWEQMRVRVYRNLDEIYAGMYDGMTEEEIAVADARFGADRKVDKLATRYPHGESYLDLITRLEPIIHELHSYEEPLLIVSHQATLRVLRAYLLRDRSMPRDLCPSVDIPQHTVMKITWDGWNHQVTPSVLEERLKAKQWPPERWSPSTAAHGKTESPIGCEEWFWLGPDPKLWARDQAAPAL
jgi:broad specificity phosphatase PhoE